MMPHRSLWPAALVLATTLVVNRNEAFPQNAGPDYPSRNIEFVVPFPPGGAADVVARLVAQSVSQAWGRAVVITNKTGATGAIANEYVAHAAPDGYTLLLASGSALTVNAAYRKDLPFDPIKSFAPVTRLVIVPNALVVNPNKVPVHSIAEFIEFARAHPGQLNFGSSGLGSSSHFAGELFMMMSKTKLTHIPYRGSGPALNDLLAGNLDLLIDNISVTWPHVQAGKLRALGVATPERTPLAPDLPAIAETLPGYQAVSWNGVAAPAGTPEPIIKKLSAAFRSAIQQPDVVKQIGNLGATIAPDSRAEFRAFITDDLSRWVHVAREINFSAKQ